MNKEDRKTPLATEVISEQKRKIKIYKVLSFALAVIVAMLVTIIYIKGGI